MRSTARNRRDRTGQRRPNAGEVAGIGVAARLFPRADGVLPDSTADGDIETLRGSPEERAGLKFQNPPTCSGKQSMISGQFMGRPFSTSLGRPRSLLAIQKQTVSG
jgi:hypothetical protein